MVSSDLKTTYLMLCVAVSVVLACLALSSMTNQNVSAQMMNPNWMMNSSIAEGQNLTGSINLPPAIFKAIAPQIKVSLSQVVTSAEKQLGNNSRVIAANIGVENRYLTYTVWAIDPDMNLHKIIIDAGNGKVLLSSSLSFKEIHNRMNGHIFNPGFMGPMMNPGFP